MTDEVTVNPTDKKLSNLPILPKGVNPLDSMHVPTLYKFKALVSWEDDNFKSTYVKDTTYFVREGNEKLHAAVQDWVLMGMVKLS